MSRKEAYIRRCISISVIVILIGCSIAACTSSRVKSKEVEEQLMQYTVREGDTLWEIATLFGPDDVDVREYIELLQKHNNITANIQPGEIIEIWTKEKTAH